MRNVTWVLGVLVICLFGYETYTLNNAVDGDTISEVVWHMTDRYGGIVGLLFGILLGHFFWPRRY